MSINQLKLLKFLSKKLSQIRILVATKEEEKGKRKRNDKLASNCPYE